MASLMFRSKSDNTFYPEAQKPSGSGTWYVFYYDVRGKKVRQRIGAHKGAASLAKGEIEAKLAKQRAGILDPEKEIKRTSITEFGQSLGELLRANNKSEATIRRYTGVFSAFADFLKISQSHLKDLARIEQHHVENFKDHRRQVEISPNGHPNAAKRKGVSVRTVNNELTYLHSIFNLAVNRGFMAKNPLKDVKKLSGQRRKRYEPLTLHELSRLIEAADDSFRPILQTFLLTGMRTGELLNLEWKDVDFKHDEINIRPKEGWRPKDIDARTIPLHSQLKPVLQELRDKSKSRYVFGQKDKPEQEDKTCPNKLLPRLKRTCKRAGLREITVHNLRDEFASHLVMAGVGIETVSRILGHSDIQVTFDHYIHLAPHRLKEAVEMFSVSN